MMKHWSLIFISLFAAVTADAAAQQPVKARIVGLETDEEYMSLLADGYRLQQQEDSIIRVVEQTRKRFTDDPENRAEYGETILELEERVFEIRNRKGDIFGRINTIEQDWLIASMETLTDSAAVAEAADSTVSEPAVRTGRLVDYPLFAETLDERDLQALRQAQDDEMKVVEYINMFSENHTAMQSLKEQYEQTQDAAEAARIYSNYKVLEGLCSALNDSIALHWSTIFDAKSYAYNLLLEKNRDDELLERNERELSQAVQRCAEERGLYASDALCSYFNTKKTMVDCEIGLARTFGLGMAQDSLSAISKQLADIDYRLPKVEIEERYFLAYEPIGVSSPPRYNSRNPIPECEIYERGTIYRIILGTFSVPQQPSIFRGVYPIYRLKTDEGKYRYFAGGFATEAEADQAQSKLKSIGFRRPEVVVWRDGEYSNLAEERKAAETAERLYRVEIEGIESVTPQMRQAIDSVASGKDITRLEERFIVLPFALREQAEQVADAISQAAAGATATVVEIAKEAAEPEE